MIKQATVDLYWKIRSLTLNYLGEAIVEMSQGFDLEGQFTQIQSKVIVIPMEDASPVLDKVATEGLTRRRDIGLSIYEYVLNNGIIKGELL